MEYPGISADRWFQWVSGGLCQPGSSFDSQHREGSVRRMCRCGGCAAIPGRGTSRGNECRKGRNQGVLLSRTKMWGVQRTPEVTILGSEWVWMAAESPEAEGAGVGCHGGAGLAGNLKLRFSPYSSAIVLFSFPLRPQSSAQGLAPGNCC